LQSSTGSESPLIKQILVPVDGSDHAKVAAQAAIRLAFDYKASLTFISIVAPPAFAISAPVGAPADLTDYYQLETEDADGAVSSVMALAKAAGVEATSNVLRPSESVVEAIIEYASNEKVDLIVVGTRGLGGFKKLLLGSVSAGVLANAPCSVFVVR
jgi:nucleotide-binding universal stress UspA family protein